MYRGSWIFSRSGAFILMNMPVDESFSKPGSSNAKDSIFLQKYEDR